MKAKLVTVLFYGSQLLGVCSSRASARTLAYKHVVELGYKIDKFTFQDLPLIR